MNKSTTAITLFAMTVCLLGCALQRAQDASNAKTQMVGMTKEQVFACMGPPTKKSSEGNTEIWSYNSGNGRVDSLKTASAFGDATATTNGNTTNASGDAFALGTGFSERRFCVVNVVLNNKQVSAVNFVGPSGGLFTQGEQCGYAIANCVHHE